MGAFLFILVSWFAVFPALAGPCDFGREDDVELVSLDIATRVRGILDAKCKSCHGLGASGGADVMRDVLNRDALLRDGMIDLAQPLYSKLFAAIGGGPNGRRVRVMPLGGVITPEEQAEIEDWLIAGAPDWDSTGQGPDPILSHEQERACIRHDQAQIERVKKDGAQKVRYLTLGHLTGQDFLNARDGACKMFQLLSRLAGAPKDCKSNRFVDDRGKILRFDLKDFEPTLTPDVWENVVIPGYPYAYVATDNKVIADYTNDINRRAKSVWAFVRADFFIARTSEADTYYKILDIPKTQDEFERIQLGLNIERELDFAHAKRGSVAKSGVTHNPRFVDWFPINTLGSASFARTQHWITRDFLNDKGRRNIYAFPAGPAQAGFKGWDAKRLEDAKVFQHDAGESITGKGDGFDMYAIWDGQGRRVNEADANVAIDRSGLYDDNVVRNPMGCIRCHAGGVNLFNDDTVIRHITGSPTFTVEEVDHFSRLFFNGQTRNVAFQKHAESFRLGMLALGLDNPRYLTPDGEPVSQAFFKFNAWMNCGDIAHELGISEGRLRTVLFHSPQLARRLGIANCDTAQLSRNNYAHSFAEMVKAFNIGDALEIKVVQKKDPVIVCRESKFKNVSNRSVKVLFQGITHEVRHGAERSFTFTGDQRFVVSSWLGKDRWNRNVWWKQDQAWTVEQCKHYELRWANSKINLVRLIKE